MGDGGGTSESAGQLAFDPRESFGEVKFNVRGWGGNGGAPVTRRRARVRARAASATDELGCPR